MKLYIYFFALVVSQLTLIESMPNQVDMDERKKPKPTEFVTTTTNDGKGYGQTGEQPMARLKKVIVNCKDWIKEYARDYKKKDKLTALVDRYINTS